MAESKPLPQEVQQAVDTLTKFLDLPAEAESIGRLKGMLALTGPEGTVHGRINKNQWMILSLLRAINKEYKSSVLEHFIDYVFQDSISLDSAGRKELVTVLGPKEEPLSTMGRIREGISNLWGDKT